MSVVVSFQLNVRDDTPLLNIDLKVLVICIDLITKVEQKLITKV